MSNKYPGGIITSGANAGYSVFFDGTGDYLSVNNAAFNFSGTDFTIEFWLYNTGTTSDTMLLQWGSGAAGDIQFVVNQGGTSGAIALGTSGVAKTAASVSANNRWVYVAGVRSGTTYYTYVDGTRYTTQSSGTPSASTSFNIASGMTGYISNLRISNTARYTSTTMVVPNILQTDANTKLWTCLGSPIVDQSGNSYTITINGDTKVSNFTPLQGYVAYNPALGASTPGIWTVSEALEARQTRRWNMYDPYFNLTTLLLHGNGTNGAQNNTFLDSSSNNFTITRNGNTTQGTFSPFSQTGWSNFFNGSTDYLTPSSSPLALGSGAYTVEFWINPASLGAGAHVIAANATNGFVVVVSNSKIAINKYAVGDLVAYNTALTTNTWTHVALVRTGTGTNQTQIYVNGISVATGTDSNNWTVTSTTAIGANSSGAGSQYFNGYLSNLRICGVAVYTSNFTPSTTPLTTTSQGASSCTFLTCQDNRFKDNGSTAATFTVGGTPSVQAFSPFYPLVAYTPQAQGGSGYFDGTGDFLTAPADAKWRFGSGDFTIEAYVYIGSGSSYNLAFHWNGTTSGTVTGTTAVRANSWNHVAVTRTGTTLNFWINGVGDASNPLTVSSTIYNNTDLLAIGKGADHTAGAGMDICHCGETGGVSNKWFFYLANSTVGSFVGFMSWFRISSSVRYTANFTPPSAPTTSDANTSLLLNFTNAGIVDSTAKNVLETVGNASISTTQSKFGGSSLAFDGSGDYLVLPETPLTNQVGDFTVEGWYRRAGAGSGGYDIMFVKNVTNFLYVAVDQTSQKFLVNQHNVGVFITGTTVTSVGVWYHFALTRSGSTVRLFVNGVQEASGTSSTNTIGSASSYIGGYFSGGYSMNGYIDDLRITNGYARYTSNTAVQTSQWQDQ